MLPPPYEWRITPTTAHLNYRYGCVAFVLPDRVRGKYRSVIEWRGHIHEARCGSVAQGVRWIERWIAAQGDRMPTSVRRRDVVYRERLHTKGQAGKLHSPALRQRTYADEGKTHPKR